jgi:peptide-methionine (R)-S-oxide reductase
VILVKYEIFKTDQQWRDELSEFEYQVLRLAGTERAYTGELLEEKRVGTYSCRGCGAELFEAEAKFDSHCGWPSFYKSLKNEAIEYLEDRAHGMVRTEVRCAKCGSHLGHLFGDAPQTPTGNRYCINSVSISFAEKKD